MSSHSFKSGADVKKFRDSIGLTQEQFAAKVGRTVRTVARWESLDTLPGDVTDIITSRAGMLFHANVSRATGQNAPESVEDAPRVDDVGEADAPYGQNGAPAGFVLVPRLALRASAGHGAVVESEQIVDHLAFRSQWIRNRLGAQPANLVLIEAVGESMSPIIGNGDLLLIDLSRTDLRELDMYVLRDDTGNLICKYLQRKPGNRALATSENPQFQPYEIDLTNGAAILGRVMWWGHTR